VPTIPWAAAVTIGAIVAPPDAVAATTMLRNVKLPHRVLVILEGEALLNDASALLIYRLAVAAVLAGGSIGAEAIAPAFLLSLVGSVVAGQRSPGSSDASSGGSRMPHRRSFSSS
jgi:monovalent cation/hydrogen antiporter